LTLLTQIDEPNEAVPSSDVITYAVPDAWGRLVGKRYEASFVGDKPLAKIVPLSLALYATDIRLKDIPDVLGPAVSKAYPDFLANPQSGCVRQAPWGGERLIICDAEYADARPVPFAPRTILKRQLAMAASHGLHFRMASELEFYLLLGDALPLQSARIGRLKFGQRQDYDLVETDRWQPLIREIIGGLKRSSIPVEYMKGESGVDQFEIVLEHAPALEAADRALIFKHWVKVAARRHGMTACFMAKPFGQEDGSGGHVHCSFDAGSSDISLEKFAENLRGNLTPLLPFFAPLPNSYKRLCPDSFAPCRDDVGEDDRSAAIRLVGEGSNRRIELRVPGADANPYLSFSALIAAGCTELKEGVSRPPADWSLNPHDAIARFSTSRMAQLAFGPDVVGYYSAIFGHEASVLAREITDWERERYWRQA
jgi:glutamine synthetase